MTQSSPRSLLADRLLSYAGARDDPQPADGGALASVAVILRLVHGTRPGRAVLDVSRRFEHSDSHGTGSSRRETAATG